ncbi:hypothetical protein [Halococcus sp. IIIV-5B]|uniref:hypothetical protein n=1 Tax=Halococcus sp. IIIV-5B TaxID=2321230 RepID=UPI000E768EF6|nr:hypothetical protein [Halococcus sp. IIIV-5B]RJT03863.1 hypothetical protein D3261_10490 [Halococcus sp. IIIV-5B]
MSIQLSRGPKKIEELPGNRLFDTVEDRVDPRGLDDTEERWAICQWDGGPTSPTTMNFENPLTYYEVDVERLSENSDESSDYEVTLVSLNAPKDGHRDGKLTVDWKRRQRVRLWLDVDGLLAELLIRLSDIAN